MLLNVKKKQDSDYLRYRHRRTPAPASQDFIRLSPVLD
jgi:hypothetical protein